MTGGGPGGTTRLYSILAYEKAIGSLHTGRARHGLSVAPVLAMFILLLARFMRHDIARPRRTQASDRASGGSWVARWTLFDLIFLPFMAAGGRSVWRGSARVSAGPTRPARPSARESGWPATAATAAGGLRIVPVLLDYYHFVQDDIADQQFQIDLLAEPRDAGTVPLAVIDTPY